MLVDTASCGGTELLDEREYQAQLQKLEKLAGHCNEVRLVDVTRLGYPLLSDALSSPADVYLELTNSCNGHCTHCYADAQHDPVDSELSYSEIEELLQQLGDLGTFYVRLTGGEPTMRPDFFAIVDLIVGTGMIASVNSNGLVGGESLCQMLERGVGDIRISLDGDEATNDVIRGRGTYQRVVAALTDLIAANRSREPAGICINMVLMKCNQHCLRYLAELVAKLGIDLSVGLLRPSGRADRTQMLSPAEVLAAARQVEELRRELGLQGRRIRINFDVFRPARAAHKPYPLDGSTCALGARGIGVTASGKVIACNYLVQIDDGGWLGDDVRGADLLAVWHRSPVLRKARKVRRQCCNGCRYHVHRCNGGCPVTAYALTGDLDGRDPYCVCDFDDGEVGAQ
jgi:radical SAM protein with 4Fe4S-binding SPASM domain